ncbi:hypothetical protein BgiBS90_037551 [Biomphalaria glabrata]|nr:hypothetical protein BgiBS90_037551 [Biomphalaria glabrata]
MTPTSERKGTKKACKMCRTGELEDAPSSKQQKTPWEGYCPGALGCRWTWPGHHDKPDSGSQEEGGGHPRQHNCRNIQTTGLDDKGKSLDERQRKDGGETRGGTEKYGRPPYPEN